MRSYVWHRSLGRLIYWDREGVLQTTPSACDNLSGKLKPNKSLASTEITPTTRATPTWTHKERRKPKDKIAASI